MVDGGKNDGEADALSYEVVFVDVVEMEGEVCRECEEDEGEERHFVDREVAPMTMRLQVETIEISQCDIRASVGNA